MSRFVSVLLGICALTIITAAGTPAHAGGYYSGDGGYYGGGYRSGYYGGGSSYRSDCCYRKVVHYERIGRSAYYGRPSYSDSYYSGRPYRSSYYYGSPHYRSYGVSYTTGYYGGYHRYECAPRRLADGFGGYAWSVKAGCRQTRW